MTIFCSPRGLSVLSFVLLAGCNDDGNKQTSAEEPRDAYVTVAITSRHTIGNVRKLVLGITPVYLYQRDGSQVRLLSDETGQNIGDRAGQPQRSITVINTLESNPVRPVTVANDVPLKPEAQGQQSHLWFYAWSLTETRSYVELDDGRFCDVNLILPGDSNPQTEGDQYIPYSLTDMTIQGGERWRIDLYIDVGMNQFNTAGCAGTTDLRVYADHVTFTRL